MRDTAAEVRDTAIRVYRRSRARARRYGRRVRQHWRTATPQQRQTAQVTAGSAALGLVVAVTAVAMTGPWDSGQRTAERSWAAAREGRSGGNHTGDGPGREPAPAAPRVLAAIGSQPGRDGGSDAGKSHGSGAKRVPPPSPSALADTLEPLLKEGDLGKQSAVSVVDASSGRQLYGVRSGAAMTPASTVKLATAAAALSARGADYRIRTRVVGDGDEVVLVGGGDPTLSSGNLGDLARSTARALRGAGHEKVSLGYDTSRFSGPERHSIGSNDNLAPVTPLMADQARLEGVPENSGKDAGHGKSPLHGPAPRSTDPAGDAAEVFAEGLEEHGVDVEGEPGEARSPRGAEELAVHRSVPMSSLVERMLTYSDNDIAEALARQTALASGEPAGFKGAAKAVRHHLDQLGLPVKGVRLADGSGLDRDGEVTPALLTRLLARAADPGHQRLRPVLTGLPVAHFTGTLDSRYGSERGKPGAGLVRAKTGTLTGVNALAGSVVDADGRLLVFAFMAKGTTDGKAAQESLDRMASALANCGCRDSPSTG